MSSLRLALKRSLDVNHDDSEASSDPNARPAPPPVAVKRPAAARKPARKPAPKRRKVHSDSEELGEDEDTGAHSESGTSSGSDDGRKGGGGGAARSGSNRRLSVNASATKGGARQQRRGSGARSRSPSASPAASSEDTDAYDEDLYENEEDKAKLMAMPEVERENILYERAERRRERRERRATLQRVKARIGTKGAATAAVFSTQVVSVKARIGTKGAATAAAPRALSLKQARIGTKGAATAAAGRKTAAAEAARKLAAAATAYTDTSSESEQEEVPKPGTRSAPVPAKAERGASSDDSSDGDKPQRSSRDQRAASPNRDARRRRSDSESGASAHSSDRSGRARGARGARGQQRSSRQRASSGSSGSSRSRSRSRSRSSSPARGRRERDRRAGSKRESSPSSDSDSGSDSASPTRRRGRADSPEERHSGRTQAESGPPAPAVAMAWESAVTLNDINMCRVPRENLEKWLNEPFFDEALKGCFVKLGVGMRNNQAVYRMLRVGMRNNQAVYRMCEVEGVTKYKRQYTMPGGMPTTKALTLRFGSAKRDFRMDTISNHRITEGEFRAWRQACAKDRVKVPTPQECQARYARAKNAVTRHQYTVEHVAEMVKRNAEQGRVLSSAALAKLKLERAIGAAVMRLEKEEADLAAARAEKAEADLAAARAEVENATMASRGGALRELEEAQEKHLAASAEVDQLRDDLAKLEEEEARKKARMEDAQGRAIKKARMEDAQGRAIKMRSLNARNRGANIAIDAATARRRQSQENGQAKTSDPFARRACRPKILWAVGTSPTRGRSPVPPEEQQAEQLPQEQEEDEDGAFDGAEETKSREALSDLQRDAAAEIATAGMGELAIQAPDNANGGMDTNGADKNGGMTPRTQQLHKKHSFGGEDPIAQQLHKKHSFGGEDPIAQLGGEDPIAQAAREEEAERAAAAAQQAPVEPRAATNRRAGMSLSDYLKQARKLQEQMG
ncbi:plus-3 domain-containing protein [Tribonema minus]|uniref:Plus-3 domain-containing protein n=1 Tax=Tribonema minus TaxID=303371 RepID=A0A836CH32_9STRA|nr:plus-3 domain-containing protein [Tribonema minus]